MLRPVILLLSIAALAFTGAGVARASSAVHTLAASGWHAPAHRVAPFARTVYGGNDGLQLDESDVTAIAVDDADSYVFVAAGSPDAYHVEVLTTWGSAIPASGLAGETGAKGLVFSGGLLYVNRCASGAIDVVDPSTLTVVDTIAIATYPDTTGCPIAVAGGRIWYQDGTTGDLASTTVATPRTSTTYPALGTFGAKFASNPAVPNELIVSGRQPTLGDSSQTVALDVSSATPTVTSSTNAGFATMALSPDGQTLYAGGGTSVTAYAVSDFAAGTTYGGDSRFVDQPAVSPDGSHVAFGIDNLGGGTLPDIYVYPTADGSQPNRSWQLPDTNYQHSGLVAFSSDGSKLYVVTHGLAARFHVLSGPSLLQSTLTAALAKSTITYGHTTTLSIHLTGFSTNRTVAIWAQPWSSLTGRQVATAQVDAATGNVVVAVSASKDTTFWATYDGDAVYGGSVGSPERALLVRFAVAAKLFNAYRVKNHVHLYHVGTSPVYALGVRPIHRGLCIDFQLEVHTSSGWRATDHCFAENRKGGVAVKVTHLRTGRLYRINAVVGDSYHPLTPTRWVKFEVTG